jgi:hypothetical protein
MGGLFSAVQLCDGLTRADAPQALRVKNPEGHHGH